MTSGSPVRTLRTLACVLNVLLLPALLSLSRADFVEFNRTIARSYADDAPFLTDATDVFSDPNWLQSYRADLATNGGFSLVKCAEVSSEDCSGNTGTVVVAISKCLSDTTVSTIKDWVVKIKTTKTAKLTYRKDDANTELSFAFVLYNSVCATSNSGWAVSRLAAFKNYGTTTVSFSTFSAPAAVIGFFKNDGDAYSNLQVYEKLWKVPFAYNFQVNEATTTGTPVVKPNAIYLAKIADLNAYSPFATGAATRVTCSSQLENGKPFQYYDAKQTKQCVCTCPRGYEMAQGLRGKLSCQPLSNVPECSECVWDSYGPFKFEVTEELKSCSLAELVASKGIPVPPLMTSCVDDGKSLGQVTLSTTPQFSSVYDGDEVANVLFKILGLVGKCDRDSLLKKRPLRLPAGSCTNPKNPALTSAATKQTKSCGWTDYQKNTPSAFSKLSISSYGKYNLSATAAGQSGSCDGCLAIVDQYRPRATTQCPTAFCDASALPATTGDVKNAELNGANVGEANTSVQQFFEFQEKAANDACSSSSSNRCDEQLFEIRNFFADKFTTSGKTYSDGRSCFSPASVWTDFLGSPTATVDPFPAESSPTLQVDAPVAPGKCMRCCHLGVKLQEKWIDYLCDSNYDTERCGGVDSETCGYNQCLTFSGSSAMTTDTQIRASIKAESENVLKQLKVQQLFESTTQVHRALSCTRFGETTNSSCTFTAKINDLIETKAAFHADWLSYGTNGKDPSKFVFWRYRVAGESGGSKWRLLKTSTNHVFNQSETQITIEAWSQCGVVSAFAFSVHLHVHSPVQVCDSFGSMWFQTFNAPLIAQDYLCNFPKSDFIELTFSYLPSLGVQYGNVSLSVDVSSVVCSASIDSRPSAEILRLANQSSFETVRRFAVQLQQIPSTAPFTNLGVQCNFTYTKYDKSTIAQTCNKGFTLRDCDEPCISDATNATCNPDMCKAKQLPGLHEACGSNVITASATQTQFKVLGSECCQSCSTATTCTPLLPMPNGTANVIGLSRCEPVKAPTVVAVVFAFAGQLLGAATSAALTLGAAIGPLASVGIAGSVVAVAAVGLFVSKAERQKREQLLSEDELYMLMEQ